MSSRTSTSATELLDQVRSRYAEAARAVSAGQPASCGGPAEAGSGCCSGSAEAGCGCCSGSAEAGCGCCSGSAEAGCGCEGTLTAGGPGVAGYSDAERAELPAAAVQASLGCGNPLAVADLHPGETVLDLGSGGGGDVLLSAGRVGPTGRVYGLDMTDEMLALARRNAAEAGVSNVEFRRGRIEEIPLPAASVDVVISNCVINLSTDKPAVFGQMHRVLRPGGRVGVADIVADDALSPAERAERGDWAGCVAGALSRSEYVDGLTAAGFADVEVIPTHQVADGMHSAIIRAVRPA